MSRNAKPRKAYKPRGVRIPMMTPTRDHLATHLHAAVETLILAPSIDAYDRLSKMLATLLTAGVAAPSLVNATDAINAVYDRYQRVQRIGVSQAEAGLLRQAAGDLDRQLATVPTNVFKAAALNINENFKSMYQGE